MDFHHSEDRRMLADTLGRYLGDRYDFDARNAAASSDIGHSPAHWSALAELGITGALFGEDAGGFSGSGFDIMTVFETLGRALAVEPFLGTLMAGRALAAGGHEALGDVVSGATIAAFAHDEATGDMIATRARRSGEDWIIDGRKAVVAQAEAAALFAISAQTDAGLSLFAVPAGCAGLDVRGYPNIDGGRSGDLAFTGMRLDADTLIGADGGGGVLVEAVVAAGLLALSAEAVGAMEVAKDATLEYLRTRVQFGVPIGKFQALQHRMATLLLEIEQARSAVINAATAYDGDDARARDRALSAAKYTVGRVGALVAEEAIQMHGGIGMTWELPLSHYAKRLVMIDHQLGDEDHHLQRYIALGAVAA